MTDDATQAAEGDRGPRDIHALDCPYAGLVVQAIDADSPGKRGELLAWLRDDHLPKRPAGSPAAMVTVFTPTPTPTPLPLDRMTHVKQVEGVGTRLTLLWFLQYDPRDTWREHFADLDTPVAASGLGDVQFVAPFIPTVPGTDR